jgi:UDP-N-acetylmuramate--alanine ligase
MDFRNIETVYFLGIGGIGMSALARYFKSQGKFVMGYDRTSTALTTELQMEGIDVHFDDNSMEIPHIVRLGDKSKILVVYTPAIPKDSRELNWLNDNGYTIMKRSQVLGLITEHTKTIAIAGTHGKTTTSSLVAHILMDSGIGCNAFLGGITSNYNSNLLLSPTSEWTVVEADEYDRSFLTLSPTISAITSMDADHLDIYGSLDYMHESFNLFARKLSNDGTLYFKKGLPVLTEGAAFEWKEYSIEKDAEFKAENIRIENGNYYFDLVIAESNALHKYNGELKNMELGLPGRHNVENAIVACAIALQVGVTPTQLRTALANFRGVKRRFEYRLKRSDLIIIDDYAHHPEELRACISSVKELYPTAKITGVFQPHLFSRTRDFADEFAVSLGLLDEIILLPIYPAREQPMPGIDSQMLLDKISKSSKILVEKSELLAELKRNEREVIVLLGAGDIDALVPQVVAAYS